MLYLSITVNVDIITLNENLLLKFTVFFLEKEGLPNAIASAGMNFINTVSLIQAAKL